MSWLGWRLAWMTRAYSEDLRIRVVRDVAAGASRRSVAFKYAVSISFVIKLVQRRSEEHTSELQSLMRISYAVFCLKKKQEITSIPPPSEHYSLHKHPLHPL